MFAAKQGNLAIVKYLFGNKNADAKIEEYITAIIF